MWHSPQNIVYQSNFGACQRARLEGQTPQSSKTNESRSFLIYDLIFEAH